MSRYQSTSNSSLKTLSHCALPDAICKQIEARRLRLPVPAAPDRPLPSLDDTFLGEHPDDVLLFPKALLGTPLFTARGFYIGERKSVELVDLHPGSGTRINYSGPELMQDDLPVYGAIIGMTRRVGASTVLRVNAERLAHVTGVQVDWQQRAARLFTEGLLSVDGQAFPLVEAVDTTNPRQWTFMLGQRQAEFLRSTAIEAVEPRMLKGIKQAMASWLVLALRVGRIETTLDADEFRQFCGCKLTDKAYLAALRNAYIALRERTDCEESVVAAEMIARMHESRKRKPHTKKAAIY